MKIFQIDENLYQSSMIDDVERAKIFDVCIDLAYKKKMKVLVHCEQGINRASLLNGVILWMKGMRGQEIVNYIRSRRPGALFNQNFVNYLVNLK